MAPLLQLEAALLRRQMPDLLLRPGMTLYARVSERQGQHGIIVLAGSPLVAQLPDSVSAGDKLRLLVEDTRGERVTMKLVQDEPAPTVQNPTVPLPLPGGQGRLTVEERESSGEAGEEHASVTLAFESPALGTVSLALSLTPGTLSVHAELAAGQPFDLASEAAADLQERIATLTGRAAQVTVAPRRQPLDLYA